VLTFLLLPSKWNYFESRAASVVTTELGLSFGHQAVSTFTGLRKIDFFSRGFVFFDDRAELMCLFIPKPYVTLPMI
jgi:hypothetical protein